MQGLLATLVAVLSIPPAVGGAAPSTAPPTGPCGAVPAGLDLIVGDADGVWRVTADGADRLPVAIAGEPTKAVRGPDGTVWVLAAVGDGPDGATELREIHRVAPEDAGAELVLTGDGAAVHAAGWLDGRTAATLTGGRRDGAAPGAAPSKFVEFSDGERVELGAADPPVAGAGSLAIGAGRVLEGATVDGRPVFVYYDATGAAVTDWFDPTDGAPDGSSRRWMAPTAARSPTRPDWVGLAWVEGFAQENAAEEVVGDLRLVVADAVTGERSAGVDLGTPGRLVHADFDGRFWVGTFAAGGEGGRDGQLATHLVVDLAAVQPTGVDLGCDEGSVPTIDRLGEPDPGASPTAPRPSSTAPASSPTTVASTTTTSPNPTRPRSCSSFVFNDNYPIRMCDVGPAVEVIQRALVAAGEAELDIDGYFGPLTDAAVRRFQAAHDLEVDGLVGPITWSALVEYAPPDGVDLDDSGVIDPWELPPARREVTPVERSTVADYVGVTFYAVETRVSTNDGEVLGGEGAFDLGDGYLLWGTDNAQGLSMVWLVQRFGEGPPMAETPNPGDYRVLAAMEEPPGGLALWCSAPGFDGAVARLDEDFEAEAAWGVSIADRTFTPIEPAEASCP